MKQHTSRTPAVQAKAKTGFFNKKGPGTFFGRPASASGGGATIQPKLTVGSPNDAFEKEADATADQVVQRLADKSYAPPPIAVAGRTAAASAQTKPIFDSKADPKDEPLQRKSNDNSASTAPPSVESGLRSSSDGTPMPASTRSQMEGGFGTDFSGVRIHNDSKASQLNKSLNAQAFAHGKDIYFDSGKYNPGSQSGQHLLAHELTHVVQQGAAGKPAVSRAPSSPAAPSHATPSAVAASVSASPTVQRVATPPPPAAAATPGPDISTLDNEALKKLGNPHHGMILKNGKEIQVHFQNMPVKVYAKEFKTGAEGKEIKSPPYTRPKKKRNTHQGSVWRTAALKKVQDIITKHIKNKDVSGKDYRFKVKNNPSIAVIGTVEQIAAQVVVPFWNHDGSSMKFQIEHKVDWQIAGDSVDAIDNLILLEASVNMKLGNDVYTQMQGYYHAVIDHYAKKGVTGLLPSLEQAVDEKSSYQVITDDIKNTSVPVPGPTIDLKDFDAADKKNPFSDVTVDIQDNALQHGQLIIYTSRSGAGNLAKYNSEGPQPGADAKYKIGGNPNTHTLDTILIKDVNIKNKQTLEITRGDKELKVGDATPKAQDHYKVATEGLAGVLKDSIHGIPILSPIIWDEIDFDIITGWHATGKVDTKLELLKNVDITIELDGNDFLVKAEITSDKLKDKLPKPFHIDYGTLYLSYGSRAGLSIGGEIGFSIDKVGQGSIHGEKSATGFALGGNFVFDKKNFKGDVTVGYEKTGNEGHWSIGGSVELNGKPFKGVESLKLTFSSSDQGLYGKGEAKLSLKGIEDVSVEAFAGNDGTLTITGIVHLGKLPKLKGGDGTLVATRKNDDWDFNINAKLIPDIDIKGLTVKEVDVSYSHGIFEVKTDAHYERGKIIGDFKLGVTNKPVTEDGKQAEGDFLSTLSFFADGTINVHIADGIGGAVTVHLTPDGDLTLDGKVELTENKPLFEMPPLRKNVFHFDQDIPLASCVVVTLSLNIHGGIDLYANMQPLVFDQGSYVGLNNLSLKNFNQATIDAHLSVSAHLDAGVIFKLGVALQADLLKVIKARVGGEGTLDFRAIEADAKATFDASWSADQGIKLKSAELDLSLTSKLIASLSAQVRVFADLWVKEIDIWTHEWELGSIEYPINLFGTGKMTIPLPVGDDGKVNLTQETMHNTIKNMGDKVTKDGVMNTAKDVLDKDGTTTDDKQGQSNSVIRQTVLDQFHDPARFNFLGNRDYLNKRYGLYKNLEKRAEDDSSVNLKDLDVQISDCEQEEYEKFQAYLQSSTFDQPTKLQMVEDFMDGHHTLFIIQRAHLISIAKGAQKK